MKKQETRDSYTRSVNRVIDYINTHYSDKLTLDKLAREGQFSPWHFHRIFKSVTGETHQEYINRIRLQKALLMMNEDLNVTGIAMAAGFATPAHFARAFKRYYHISPAKVRKQFRKTGSYSIPGFPEQTTGTVPVSAGNNGSDKVPYKLLFLREYSIAYVRHIGNYDFRIGMAWKKLMSWGRRNGVVNGKTLRLSCSQDNPEISPSGKLKYDACITLPSGFSDNDSGAVSFRTIPAGTYAAFQFDGGLSELTDFYDAVYRTIITDPGLKLNDEQDYRIHRESVFKQIRGNYSNELRIPVQKAGE